MVTGDDDRSPRPPYILGMELLRSLRARIERWDPRRVDELIALAFLIEAELEVLLLMDGDRHAGGAALLQVGFAVALAIRRRAPFASLTLCLLTFVAFQPLGKEVNDHVFSAFFAVLFVLFSFGLHEPNGRRIAAGLVLGFLANAVAQAIDAYSSTVVDYVTGGLVIACGPILLGRVIHSRSDLNATLRAKAEELRQARTDQAEQAAVEERNRIA